MPHFIKTGYWEKAAKGFFGWLDLDLLIKELSSTIVGPQGPPGPMGTVGLYAQTALGPIISGTTVDSTLIGTGVGSLTVPANGFSVGDSFTAKMCGKLSCVNNETLHIRVKAGSVVIIDAGAFTMNAATNKYFDLTLDFTITKIGAAGVAELFANGQFLYDKNSGSTLEGKTFASIDSTTFDTTISNTLDITAHWGSTNVLNSIQSQNFVLSKTY